MSEKSEFKREEYSDLPGPDPRRNVDQPDMGYVAVADRNWPGGEDGKCIGREWGWDIERAQFSSGLDRADAGVATTTRGYLPSIDRETHRRGRGARGWREYGIDEYYPLPGPAAATPAAASEPKPDLHAASLTSDVTRGEEQDPSCR